MKRKYLHFAMLSLSIPLFLATGCQSGGKRAPGTIDDKETGEIVDRLETLKQVYHLCPSPAEMLSVIDVADLNFKGELLNPPENADKYLDTKSTTLALGIYITDLAYAALFGRQEETLDYLEVVRSVAERVRVTGAINDELIQKAKDNVEYLDSLFNISNEVFINMLFYCERNNRSNTIVILSAGAFIESLYLAVNLVDDYENAGFILQHLAEQKYAIDNLMVFAESLQDEDENIASVLENLHPLKEIYDGFDMGSRTITIKTQDEVSDEQRLCFHLHPEDFPQKP
ncbi:MAG TPA: hypothetical protein ENI20_07030 [Bacteroides sp.]|nr:hypothetical protein [Bacteroides sp.]